MISNALGSTIHFSFNCLFQKYIIYLLLYLLFLTFNSKKKINDIGKNERKLCVVFFDKEVKNNFISYI
jgi:hypothetical protein